MSTSPRTFRFRPRFAAVAWLAIVTGVGLMAYGLVAGASAPLAIVMGLIGVVLGAKYLLSPVWKMRIAMTEDGLRVGTDTEERFSLRWDEIESLIVTPASKTCFVYAGDNQRNILIPGPGANASYDIDNKEQLYEFLRERVDSARIREVEHLGKWLKQRRRMGATRVDDDGASPDGGDSQSDDNQSGDNQSGDSQSGDSQSDDNRESA